VDVTDEAIPQWPDEAVAEAFRAEIRARFEAHNAAFRSREAAELEVVLREHPEKRGQPGYEVRDSGAWEIYQASEIRIDRNSVTIVLPTFWAIGIDLVYLFDHTTTAWSRPRIGATIVDGEARVTIEITLVATWTDEMDAKWRGAGNDRKHVLVELYEDDVRKILGVISVYNDKFGQGVDAIRERLELALVPLP
jgi:hypothetical protein